MAAGGFITLTFVVEQEGKQFASHCVELGTTSAGKTLDEAAKNIREATMEYLDAIEALGERRRIFRERGITLRKKPPVTIRREYRVQPGSFIGPYVAKIPATA